ncbi:histidine phosphatase family protein [Glaciecola siphonariae]|uniref:Histidine phosphatase family protein n=1 Tax=Glaciecola siphonariae TaxID=521012 RepID=A0ABV9LVG9_9ALTE
MAELYLIRHGQASFGSENYDKLSALGHEQSERLGRYFAERQLHFDHIITGDMVRHKETAQGILRGANHQGEFAMAVDHRWNEFDFNAVVGAYLQMYPEQKPAETAPRSDWYRVLKSAMVAWSEKNISVKNEDWEGFQSRVKSAGQAVLESRHSRVLVVSSGGAIALTLMHLLGVSVAKAIDLNLQIKNTSVHHVFFNQHNAQLSSFNNVPHLDEPELPHLVTYS